MAVLVVKATRKCNSQCAYCHVRDNRSGQTMSAEGLAMLFRRIDDYLRESPDRSLEILWHGGEPLLPGIPFLKSIIELQDLNCRSTKSRIRHSLQSNLTLLREPVAEQLGRLGIESIGTSLDPLPGMRGPRTEAGSVWYMGRWLRGHGVLVRNGFEWGVIYVVTREALGRGRELFRFLTNLNLAGRITFAPVMIHGGRGRELAITPAEFVSFLSEVMADWLPHTKRFPAVEPLATLLHWHSSRPHEGNGDFKRHSFGDRHLSVEPDLAVYPCGLTRSPDEPCYGSLEHVDLAELLLTDEAYLNELFRSRERSNGCRRCPIWTLCGAGRLRDTFTQNDVLSNPCEWCHARHTFLQQYADQFVAASG